MDRGSKDWIGSGSLRDMQMLAVDTLLAPQLAAPRLAQRVTQMQIHAKIHATIIGITPTTKTLSRRCFPSGHASNLVFAPAGIIPADSICAGSVVNASETSTVEVENPIPVMHPEIAPHNPPPMNQRTESTTPTRCRLLTPTAISTPPPINLSRSPPSHSANAWPHRLRSRLQVRAFLPLQVGLRCSPWRASTCFTRSVCIGSASG